MRGYFLQKERWINRPWNERFADHRKCGAIDSALAGFFHVAAAYDFVCAGGDAGDGFGVGDVFFDKDAVGEGVGVVSFENGNGALEDDDAVVEVLIDEVNGAAGDLDAVIEGLGLGFEAGKGGQERRVDVEDAVGVGRHEFRR